MTLSKKLEKLIKSSPEILPVKTEQGILVGTVLIVSQGFNKDLYKKGKLMYSGINLNAVAIKMANLLAKNLILNCDKLYQLDQEYGKWFTDSQMMRSAYEKAVKKQDHDRADVLWARYIESRERTMSCKIRAEALAKV
jgi:hypothetical protein